MPPGVPPAAPARARRADAATNRVALVRAAQTVLARDPHASIDTIAREAGLSRRAVYGHFPDRDSLVRAVIAVAAERFNAIATSTESPSNGQTSYLRSARLMRPSARRLRERRRPPARRTGLR